SGSPSFGTSSPVCRELTGSRIFPKIPCTRRSGRSEDSASMWQRPVWRLRSPPLCEASQAIGCSAGKWPRSPEPRPHFGASRHELILGLPVWLKGGSGSALRQARCRQPVRAEQLRHVREPGGVASHGVGGGGDPLHHHLAHLLLDGALGVGD